ncbi:DUF6950 family protein [Alloyangia pacifica]|uniref:DUF6950 family protein n=1 Tax=Alloyangia pacifica TaxID=311180 RepID=UPI001CFD51A2|nr:hypothetical protein [Alloyangia pacifica]
MTDIIPAEVHVPALMQEMNRWNLREFQWGEMDCGTTVADWVWRVKGADPMAHVRGMYDSPASCQKLLGVVTDPVGAYERCFATIGGLPRVDAQSRGDVAVCARYGERFPIGAIWNGRQWISKGRDCVTFLDARIVQPFAIWGLGYAE